MAGEAPLLHEVLLHDLSRLNDDDMRLGCSERLFSLKKRTIRRLLENA
jgi:hypothetical protein